MRVFHLNKQAIYPFDEWEVVENEFIAENNHRNETIFAVGNGYMGLRGIFEEGLDESIPSTPGTYINGIYETEEIIYGEFAANQPKEYQTMISVTDWRRIELFIGNERVRITDQGVTDYRRALNMRTGVLSREFTWTSPGGKTVHVKTERFVSQVDKHAAVIRYQVTPVNFDGEISLLSVVDGNVRNLYHLRERALQVLEMGFTNNTGYMLSQTKRSGFFVGCAVRHQMHCTDDNLKVMLNEMTTSEDLSQQFRIGARQGITYTLDKFVSVTTSRETPAEQLTDFLTSHVNYQCQLGFKQLWDDHVGFMTKYWESADVIIEGDPALQQAFRFNTLHLLQSTGRDGKTNVAAKGLTGEYYEGHYFWDTETYIIPFFLYSQPELVKNLLLYRHSTLDPARQNAKRMRSKGALYSWRTINGHEASGNFLGSTVQYHINADVAFAIHKYVEATEDYQFLADYGAEILFETARCWADRGAFIPSKGGKYCINEVCGPDEYKPGVNNNCYTNYMAKLNLDLAVEAFELMSKEHPSRLETLSKSISLETGEIEQWKRCSANMFLPYDEQLGIHPQDDSFLDKDPIDVDSIPDQDIPLVANWHPLVIWRFQVIKQADVILLMFLLGNLFTKEQKKANFDYYEPKTTHDSSLSPAIYSIIASEIGYHEYAYNYFMQTARLDLDDYNKNAWQGIHTACMAGSWMCVVNGFAGMRTYDGQLYFTPVLPEKWTGLAFRIRFKGRTVRVEVKKERTKYSLVHGPSLEVYHHGKNLLLQPGKDLEVATKF